MKTNKRLGTKKIKSSRLTKSFDLGLAADALVIVPCYNEAENIVHAIENLKKECICNFLVVNDCSTDDTLEILKKKNWNHISNNKNLGLSGSFREGIKYAVENGYRYVIQYDGDGQHNPQDIYSLLSFAQKGYDIVVTSRYYSKMNLSKKKIMAHKILRNLILLKTGERITDPTCGLRLYNWVAMENFLKNDKLEVEPSTLAYLVAIKKLKIKEIPTTVFERKNGESIFITTRSAFKYMWRQCIKVLFLSLNKGKVRGY